MKGDVSLDEAIIVGLELNEIVLQQEVDVLSFVLFTSISELPYPYILFA